MLVVTHSLWSPGKGNVLLVFTCFIVLEDGFLFLLCPMLAFDSFFYQICYTVISTVSVVPAREGDRKLSIKRKGQVGSPLSKHKIERDREMVRGVLI